MKKFRIYVELKARTEEEAFREADEMVENAVREESTIANTFSIKEIKK